MRNEKNRNNDMWYNATMISWMGYRSRNVGGMTKMSSSHDVRSNFENTTAALIYETTEGAGR
jgi:hypothetical protein